MKDLRVRADVSRHGRYFTLIEMLVVIGILGILAAAVSPAIFAARDRAQASYCGNNLKTLGDAVKAYSTENKGYFPMSLTTYYVGAKKTKTEISWGMYLTGGTELYPVSPAYIDSTASLRCSLATYDAVQDQSIEHTYGQYYVPVSEHDRAKNMEFPDMPFTQWAKTAVASNGKKTTTTNAFFVMRRIKYPQRFPMFADTVSVGGNANHQHFRFNPRRMMKKKNSSPVQEFGIHLRHGNQANIVFADGHSKAMGEKEFPAADITAYITADLEKVEKK